jgi:dipeptidyl aminopeptidase/acylaminoacyl peptidase
MWFLAGLLALTLTAQAAQRPIEFADIIELKEVATPKIAPDGRRVAFVVRQSSLAGNSAQSSLWLAEPGGTPRRLLAEGCGGLEWMPGGAALSATLSRPGKTALWRIPLDGAPQPLFEHPTRLGAYAWSPDGERLLFLTTEDSPAGERARIDREGVVYDGNIHGIRSFTQHNWAAPGRQQLWVWRLGAPAAERVTVDLEQVKSLGRFAWSPDGNAAAFDYVPKGATDPAGMTSHIGVLEFDRQTGRPRVFTPRVTTGVANRNPQWRARDGALVFVATGEAERTYGSRSVPRLLRPGAASAENVALAGDWHFVNAAVFDASGDNLLIEYDDLTRSTLYRAPLRGGSAAPVIRDGAHYTAFHFTPDRRWAACLRQSFTSPPEAARVDLSTGAVEVLTKLNPQFDSIALQPGVERRWRNRFGQETNGYLVLPPARKAGERVPLVVVQYNFSNVFTTQAQWITSYPVQHLARAGIAVLLHNPPRPVAWKPGDFEGAAQSQAYNPLASLETAIRSLAEEGIADPARVGIAGWSFGAYLAELALTQTRLFAAASAGEGGLNNAGQYWVTGSAAMQAYLDAFFGGPPFGAAYANYQRLAPALNAHRVEAPLLREYGTDVGVQSLEFLMALKRLGKPVEQIIYPGAPHILSLPSQRRASMERNLDWFRFWLQEYEDPAPGKRPQYLRWRAMRKTR